MTGAGIAERLTSPVRAVAVTSADPSMQAYYAARAPYYDAVYDKPERRADIAHLREYLPARFAGKSVLEIACGTGYWSQHIAPAAASFVAVDATAEPLEFARLRPGTAAAKFLLADAYELPESLGMFSAAFAGLWLSHVPIESRARFLAGLHRHLLPGAEVILIDNSEVQLREHPIAQTDAEGNTYQYRQLRDGSVHRVLKNFPTRAELEAMVAGIGTPLRHEQLDNFWLFEYARGEGQS